MNSQGEKLDLISSLTKELLERMGIGEAEVLVREEKDGAVKVSIQTEQAGILIGARASRLKALQLILRMIVAQRLGEWLPLLLDINNYRQRRRLELEKMAKEAAEKAASSQENVVLPPMSAYDRRIIHLVLSGDSRVETESVGEGEARRVVVKPSRKQ